MRHGGTGSQVYDLIVARTAGKWITPTIQRVDVERTTLMLMIPGMVFRSLTFSGGHLKSTPNVRFIWVVDVLYDANR